jgi:DNA-binding response OmpR family regulator
MSGESVSLRVLLVDDEALIRWAVAETLGAAGHAVAQASNAAAARRAVREAPEPFDIILLDYRLPDSDDFALLIDLRQSSPSSCIVMMTADTDAMPEIALAARRHGACLALTKPIDMNTLGHMVLAVHRAMRRDLRPKVLSCGDHACAIYSHADELLARAADFIVEGLAHEEQCWWIPADGRSEAMDEALRQRRVDVDDQKMRGALRIVSPAETYLERGRFDPWHTLDRIGDAADRALRDGFAGLRATADMAWALKTPGAVDHLIEYESALTTRLVTARVAGLCLYHRKQTPLGLLDGVLATHPVAGLSGASYHANPFFDPGVHTQSQADGQAVTAKLELFELT